MGSPQCPGCDSTGTEIVDIDLWYCCDCGTLCDDEGKEV